MEYCPHCNQQMVYCRVCARFVCERAREMHQTRPGEAFWRCNSPDWCTHGGLAKKDRFAPEQQFGGGERLKDNVTEQSHAWQTDHDRHWTFLKIINDMAFELEMLKEHHVKDTE